MVRRFCNNVKIKVAERRKTRPTITISTLEDIKAAKLPKYTIILRESSSEEEEDEYPRTPEFKRDLLDKRIIKMKTTDLVESIFLQRTRRTRNQSSQYEDLDQSFILNNPEPSLAYDSYSDDEPTYDF